MDIRLLIRPFLALLFLSSLAACGGNSAPVPVALPPLSADNINLIFVVTPDLNNNDSGDINPDTANLSSQGLQRSLLMATYLKERVLGSRNASGISVLSPMTHLQTANKYPDMAAIGFMQQFALLNQISILGTTGNSFPLGTGYTVGTVPDGVAQTAFPASCQGLVFNDVTGANLALATRIITTNVSGHYLFAAPWKTVSTLMRDINQSRGYNLSLPASYQSANYVYAISVAPSGNARLATYNSNLKPSSVYPVLPAPVAGSFCTQQSPFVIRRTAGVNGAVTPAGINTNQTVYLIRHAEAHPVSGWDDGNYVAAGQWRALALPNFLSSKISPTRVYSIDPAQSFALTDDFGFSYVRPSLTVLPYAIANNLPYNLAADFSIMGPTDDPTVARKTSNFFFTNRSGNNFSGQTILVAWEHEHFPPLITALVNSYGGSVPAPSLTWPGGDYDTIWTVKLDSQGNLTVDNALCEGIDSSKLPAAAPMFY